MVAILISFIFAAIISFIWVRGIDNMKKKHPDYKGEDFLNWDKEDKKEKPESPEWDDNQVHTEGTFN
jgi:hypothetical protein